MIKPSAINIASVTPEQIGMCHKVLHRDGNFYQVQSESDPDTEYTVRYSKERGFSCSCRAGQEGFKNCTTAASQGVCKHVRWSLACAKEERDYMAALADRQAQELAEIERIAKRDQEIAAHAEMVARQNADAGYSRALAMTHWNR